MPHLLRLLTTIFAFITRTYYRLFGEDYFNRHHLEFTFTNGVLSYNWLDHDEYTLIKEAEISRLRDSLLVTDFITAALKTATHCNFISFDCGDDSRFVQFWLGDGEYKASWPLLPRKNKLTKYRYPMLGVLNELNIAELLSPAGNLFKPKYQCYEITEAEGFPDYQIHFRGDAEKASQFVQLIFTEVFRQDLSKLQFRIG